MSPAGPRPGWYLDPDRDDFMRYWNGSEWTEHSQQQIDGAKRFWIGLRDQTVGRILIGSIAAVIVIVGAIIIAQRPWTNESYEDCISANQSAVNGIATPGYSQNELEAYCAQHAGK